MRNRPSGISKTLEAFSAAVTNWTGSTSAFACATAVIVLWAVLGPLFGFSNTWQLVINTGTTIVTFLMVFLIQRSQNKDALAIHLKLNELVAAMAGASNRMIDVEAFSEKDLQTLHEYFRELAKLAREEIDVSSSRSVEEARLHHSEKSGKRAKKS